MNVVYWIRPALGGGGQVVLTDGSEVLAIPDGAIGTIVLSLQGPTEFEASSMNGAPGSFYVDFANPENLLFYYAGPNLFDPTTPPWDFSILPFSTYTFLFDRTTLHITTLGPDGVTTNEPVPPTNVTIVVGDTGSELVLSSGNPVDPRLFVEGNLEQVEPFLPITQTKGLPFPIDVPVVTTVIWSYEHLLGTAPPPAPGTEPPPEPLPGPLPEPEPEPTSIDGGVGTAAQDVVYWVRHARAGGAQVVTTDGTILISIPDRATGDIVLSRQGPTSFVARGELQPAGQVLVNFANPDDLVYFYEGPTRLTATSGSMHFAILTSWTWSFAYDGTSLTVGLVDPSGLFSETVVDPRDVRLVVGQTTSSVAFGQETNTTPRLFINGDLMQVDPRLPTSQTSGVPLLIDVPLSFLVASRYYELAENPTPPPPEAPSEQDEEEEEEGGEGGGGSGTTPPPEPEPWYTEIWFIATASVLGILVVLILILVIARAAR